MSEEKVEGIVLRSQDYKESHRIITVFTPCGLIDLIVKGISRKNARLLSLTTPFCHAEYLFRKGRSELLSFRDGSILNEHLGLRKSLSALQLAGSLASAILSSQMKNKPAPGLFALYKAYHQQAAQFPEPQTLTASFYLKLLRHEGLLILSDRCSHCPATPLHIHEGESLCLEHTPHNSFSFTSTEWQLLQHLDNSTQFSTLHSLRLPPTLFQKIQALFTSTLL